jgi:SAM-dependent methyltransferase
MPGSYTVLAPIYDVAGFSGFSRTITPQLLRFLLQRDWMGRSILDLGCGIGTSIIWLKQQGYNVAGVDQSPEMLRAARQNFAASGTNATLYEHDIRRLDAASIGDSYDLVLALNVLNELDNVRDLEAVFKNVHALLKPGQVFAFDLHTLEGLGQHSGAERLFFDAPETLTVFTRLQYDYERQVRTIRYLLFERQADGHWQRQQTDLSLRGYPVQAVVGLLQRSGFEIVSVLTGSFAPYEPSATGIDRVFIIGKKV